MGHGMRAGALEPMENYYYAMDDPACAELFIARGAHGGDPLLDRTRGYPFFLGLIYRVAGVHPRVGKLVQLALVILLGAGLPGLGFYLWRGAGILPGMWAGLYYIGKYTLREKGLLAEPLFAFLLFVWTCLFVYWQRSRKLMGGVRAWGSGWLLCSRQGHWDLPVSRHGCCAGMAVVANAAPEGSVAALVMFVVGYGVVAVPYIVMVSRIAGKLVLFSTQDGDHSGMATQRSPRALFVRGGVNKSAGFNLCLWRACRFCWWKKSIRVSAGSRRFAWRWPAWGYGWLGN